MSFTSLLNQFHFIRPFWLFALIPYIAVMALTIRSKLSQGDWSQVCDAVLLPYLLQDKAAAQSHWLLPLGALAGILSIIALAGPTWERLPAPAFRNDSALVILFDLSKTMNYADLKPNRLERARYKISDILTQRKDGQSALLAYSGDAFVVTPLTTDKETIANQLSALTPEIMPSDGDELSRALDKAVDLFKQAGLQKGQIIVLTDGGGLDDGIDRAKSLGNYRLLVLGIGAQNNEPIPLPSGDFVKDSKGGIILGTMDTEKLQNLAQAGGGAYHTLTSDDSDINALLNTIAAQLQTQDGKNENLLLEQWRDQGPWLLLAVLPLAALSFRKGVFMVLLVLFLPWPETGYAFDLNTNWEDLWQTKNQQAQNAYRQGDYNKAAELFENPDWQAAAQFKSDRTVLDDGKTPIPKTATGFYNRGNVLAKSGKLQEAIDAYNEALKLHPDDEDARFNKDLVSKELEKQKKEQQQDQNQDKPQQNPQQNKNDRSSDQSNQQQNSQQSGEKNQDDNKPEQKPEQSQEDLEKQTGQQDAKENPKPEENKQQSAQAEPTQKDDQQEHKQSGSQTAAPVEMSKEEQQASEQWLKRIPDDPAGLLRRKFKYQYDQRGQQ